MKIGLSYSRCLIDILENRVDRDDVLVIITRTNFNPHDDTQWGNIWVGYVYDELWAPYNNREEELRSLTLQLYEDGKIHQPRQFGAHPRRLPYYWLETVLPDIELENNPAAKKAWDNFQTFAQLINIKLDTKHE